MSRVRMIAVMGLVMDAMPMREPSVFATFSSAFAIPNAFS